MKKILLFIIILGFSTKISAQTTGFDWKNSSKEQRREALSKMTPQERMTLLKQFKEDLILQDLNIPQANQAEFKKIFSEYQESQKAIREKFKNEFQSENLSNAEAKQRLDESFQVTQQLLDNRKKYAEKFLKFLTPQQVLKLFQSEGKMRDRVLDHRDQSCKFRNKLNSK